MLIFHVDINSAFLSWSALKKLQEDPGSVDLRKIPSAVGGDVNTRHGVITAKSIPAKKYGIKTGEPVVTALKKCPSLLLVPADFTAYRSYSAAFIKILSSYTDKVEQVSIDEAFLDLSDHEGKEEPISLANRLKDQVKRELGFTVNVGISNNKLLAKMASDFTKPDRVHTLYPNEIRSKMWPLPIGELYGCGGASSKKLSSVGILTIGDAAQTSLSYLQDLLGEKAGAYIHRSANGIGSDVVKTEERLAKSYSNETTTAFDIVGENYEAEMLPLLKKLSKKVATRMKKDQIKAFTIGIQVKTSAFQRRSRQLKLSSSTNEAQVIYQAVKKLSDQLLLGSEGLFAEGMGIRLIGVFASGLDDDQFHQMDLSELLKRREEDLEKEKVRKEQAEKKEKLRLMTQQIRSRFGDDAISPGFHIETEQDKHK
jgi:DNA polymerase IV